jgi:hypothetical protein
MFGVKNDEQEELFSNMLHTAPVNYFARAINCIVQWRNKTLPSNSLHLHGTSDRIIPSRFVKNYTAVKNGSHFMVLNSPEEVNAYIKKILLS